MPTNTSNPNEQRTMKIRFCGSVLALVTLWSAVGQSLAAPPNLRPLEPTQITLKLDGEKPIGEVLAAITKQAGAEIDATTIDRTKLVRGDWQAVPLWKVLEDVAGQTGSRIDLNSRSRFPRLIPVSKAGLSISSIDGPFRIVAKEVLIRGDLEGGRSSYDLTLEVAWEPRVPVIRIDSVPRELQGKDDAANPITHRRVDNRNPVEGMVTRSTVRLEGLKRESKKIATLQGEFLVTSAEEMVRVSFGDLKKGTGSMSQKGVVVDLRSFTKDGNYWIATVQLKYPPDGPVFESFETYWLSRNRIFLVSPDGTKRFEPMGIQEDGSTIAYRFQENATTGLQLGNREGWKLEYETPGPMREVPVKFNLSNIPLP